MNDPFAAAPAPQQTAPQADEAQSAPPAPQESPWDSPPPEAAKPVPAARPAFADAEGKLVTTFKAGLGYDQPWVVIHANSVEESDALLDQSFADYLAKVKRVAAFFNGTSGAPAAAPQGAAPQQRQAPPPGAQSAPGGETRTCVHGQMQFKSGVSKSNGKPWSAFMCPTPKGTPGQCEAEWIR